MTGNIVSISCEVGSSRSFVCAKVKTENGFGKAVIMSFEKEKDAMKYAKKFSKKHKKPLEAK